MNTAMKMLLFAGGRFDPARLFRNGEQGGLYYASNPITDGAAVWAYQDSAGTTPVTAVGQPVGLTLDRRFGLYRGPQLMGAAYGNNGWTPSGMGGTKAVSGSTGSLFATVNPTANRMHEMIVVVSAISGTITPQLGNVPSTNITTPGTHYRYITPTAGTLCYLDAPAATTATVASVSIRELPGNHRIQATSGSRKTLSARVNLLLASATMSTQNVTTVATSYKLSFTGTGTVTLSGTSTAGPLVGTGASDRVSLTFTPTAGTLTLTVSGSVTLADLRTADDAAKSIPAYQRVNTASDYDTDGFYHANVFDGTDDNDTCATGGGNTSGLMLVSTITVQGGAGTNRVIWSDIGTNTGWRVRINTSNQLEISAGNGSAYTTVATTATLPVGETHVISAWEDGANLCVQIDNGAVASTAKPTISAGTAGFTIGKENGAASGYFFGRIYDVVARWSGYNPTEHARLKTWAGRLAGMTL